MNIGITGHQDLGSEGSQAWIKEMLTHAVVQSNPSCGFSSLARGADQLFTDVLKERGVKYVAVIPCQRYEATFEHERDLKHYKALLAAAADTITLNFVEPNERAFFEAGKYIVKQSEALIAVWDGHEAKGLGGTGDVVEHALREGKKVIHINPITTNVKELYRGEK